MTTPDLAIEGMHDLSTEGACVQLRDVSDVRARDRKATLRALSKFVTLDENGDITESSFDPGNLITAASDIAEAVASMLLVGWDIPYLNVAPSLDAIGDLKTDDYDRLLELVEPAVRLFLPSSSNNVDDHGDEQSPSVPASG